MTRLRAGLPGQVVLVLQGGGALGAYQVGVYEALHEAGIEPDWVIGTSIGAINGAIIAGNKPEHRLPRLRELWERFEQDSLQALQYWPGMSAAATNFSALTRGRSGLLLAAAAGLGRLRRRTSAWMPRPITAPHRCARRSLRWSTSPSSPRRAHG